jgi:hypothetical protein
MTKQTSFSWTSIRMHALNFRYCEMLLDCAACGCFTQVHIRLAGDGTLFYGSFNADEHFSVAKKSPCKPYLEVTQDGSLLILCGQCISNEKELLSLALKHVAGMSSIKGKSNRCQSRNHEGFICGLPAGHEQKFDHCHSVAGNPMATWKGDFDGGFYISVRSVTPGIDKTPARSSDSSTNKATESNGNSLRSGLQNHDNSRTGIRITRPVERRRTSRD